MIVMIETIQIRLFSSVTNFIIIIIKLLLFQILRSQS